MQNSELSTTTFTTNALKTLCLTALAVLTSCGGAPSSEPQSPASPHGQADQNAQEQTTKSDNDSNTTDGKATKGFADFSLETLDGNTVALSDYVGKNVVLVDFWATWCEPCLAAMPHFNDLYSKYKNDGFMLLSVSVDGPESVAEVRSYVHRQGLTFPVLLDQESRAISLYNSKGGVPFSVLFAKDGTVLHKRDKIMPGDEEAIDKEIAKALGK